MNKPHLLSMVSTKISVATLLTISALLTPTIANASIANYSGTYSDYAIFSVAHNGESTDIADDSSTRSISVEVDTVAPSLKYNELSFNSSGVTTSFTDSYTIGFGETTNITTSLTFNEIVTSLASNTEPLGLTPTSGGIFNVSNPACSITGVCFEQLTVSGTYEISGPTETQMGAFSLQLETGYAWGTSEFVNYDLDTNSFPSELVLTGSPYLMSFGNYDNSDLLFDVVVDGVNHSSSFNYVTFLDTTGSVLSPSTVPIPSAIWLFSSGLLGLIGLSRRTQKHSG
jgi:hypothetical protein